MHSIKEPNMGTGRITRSLAGVMAVAVSIFITALPGQAQQPQPQGQEDLPEISQEELDTFADAYLEIDQIRLQMQTQMQSAQDQETANQIQQEANEQIGTILEEHGFTVEEYQQITQILNVDPEQRAEFQELLEEKQAEDDPPAGVR